MALGLIGLNLKGKRMCRQPKQTNTHALGPGERPVSELGLSRQNTAVLQIARCYFQSFAQPASQSWLQANRVAKTELCAASAPEIAVAVLEMVQNLRLARRSTFHFSNPFCASCSRILTAHERLMMATFKAIAAGKPEVARGHAMLLCEGNDTDAYLRKTAHLAACLKRLQTAA